MTAVSVFEGADHGHFSGQAGQVGEMAAKGDSWQARFDFPEHRSIFAWRGHLGVERFNVGWATLQEQQDYGLFIQGADTGCLALRSEQLGKRETSQSQGTNAQQFASRYPFAITIVAMVKERKQSNGPQQVCLVENEQ